MMTAIKNLGTKPVKVKRKKPTPRVAKVPVMKNNSPLDMMLLVMQAAFEQGSLSLALNAACKAAPYINIKCSDIPAGEGHLKCIEEMDEEELKRLMGGYFAHV